MPRRLSPEHQLELESLYRVLRVFGDFLDPLLPPTGGTFSAALRRAYEGRDLRGLRLARSDLLAMAQAGTASQRRQLDGMLRERAGVSLDDLSERQLKRIAQIRARGKLTSEEQYYLVRERFEFIADDPARAEERGELQAMLHAYEERVARRTGA